VKRNLPINASVLPWEFTSALRTIKPISKERKLNHNTDLTRTGIQHWRLGPAYDVTTNRACDCISRTLVRTAIWEKKNAFPVFLTLSIRLYQYHYRQKQLGKKKDLSSSVLSSLDHVTFRVIEAILRTLLLLIKRYNLYKVLAFSTTLLRTLERLNQFSKLNFKAAQPFFRSL